MRMIDADILADEIESMKISVSGRPSTFDEAKSDVMQVIDEQPTVYAAEVLRDQWISVMIDYRKKMKNVFSSQAGTTQRNYFCFHQKLIHFLLIDLLSFLLLHSFYKNE